MTRSIPPHGGTLIDRTLTGATRDAALERAQRLPRVALNEVALADLEMIAVGALSPLVGFMTRADYLSVRDHMRLANGLPWGLPVTLTVPALDGLRVGQSVALNAGGQPLAILDLEDIYEIDPLLEAQRVYRTADPAHPGVARLYQQGRIALGGAVHVINVPGGAFPELRLTPAQTRAEFAARGWRRIVAFQTRNPIHRAHEYMHKVALEIVDGLLLHPLIGETKADDVPAAARIASYRALLAAYYPADRVVLAAFPAAMRYAGPREAIWHAIARKNYGCTHIIIGRDHAGVGSYYGSYDAQHIFDEFTPEEIGITPLFFEHTFYCRACGAVVSRKTCPHDSSCHVVLSGTQVRALLARGEAPPPEFTRPEVAAALLAAMQQRDQVY
ncbi:MAG: sulfate adenylyltransferase [Anaerolinea sp.]